MSAVVEDEDVLTVPFAPAQSYLILCSAVVITLLSSVSVAKFPADRKPLRKNIASMYKRNSKLRKRQRESSEEVPASSLNVYLS